MPLDAFTQTTRTVRGTKPTVHTSRDRPYSTVFFHMKVLNNRRVGVSVFRGAAVTREREREREKVFITFKYYETLFCLIRTTRANFVTVRSRGESIINFIIIGSNNCVRNSVMGGMI